ncbi:MAG: hypothetical protein M1120_01510 [Patescibacteria group bacterium]|nr:hypothetical protein [Patescibacteria group bacterium]
MLKKLLSLLKILIAKWFGQNRQRKYVSRQKIAIEEAREQIKRIRAKGLSLPIFTL